MATENFTVRVQIFNGQGTDDNDYLTWMENNPLGFVMNTRNRTLHKSKCVHITSTTGFEKGIFTEKAVMKICSNDLNELYGWCQKSVKFAGEFKECGSCKPYSKKAAKHPVFLFPEVVEQRESLFEGAQKLIAVNTYERNQKAREECLRKYGYACSVCDIDFGKVYGEIGKGFIHVHHLKEISDIGKTYQIDPITDLRPVCPNCHSMLHQRRPCYTINELKAIINAV